MKKIQYVPIAIHRIGSWETITKVCPICLHTFILLHNHEDLRAIVTRLDYLMDVQRHYLNCFEEEG